MPWFPRFTSTKSKPKIAEYCRRSNLATPFFAIQPMTDASPRFSVWRHTATETLVSAPTGNGVIQVKTSGTLRRYPKGKSAMLWYGSADNCRTTLKQLLPKLAAAFPHESLRWRVRTTDNAPQEHQRLLVRFIQRFGAPPIGNTSFE